MTKSFLFKITLSNKGQSTVEYVCVSCALLLILVGTPLTFHKLKATFFTKYESYAFAVAVSDPPSAKIGDKVHELTDPIEKINTFIEHMSKPSDKAEKTPSYDVAENFIKKIYKKN